MKKITALLALASMAGLSLSANADVIKPINDNSAIKIVLPLPASDYYGFTMMLDGKVIKVGEVIPVDGPKCLDFNFVINDLALNYTTRYCGQFLVGKTTEIVMPAVQLAGATLTPDTLYAKQTHRYTFQTPNRSYLALKRLPHDFALPKLLPYLVHETTIELAMPIKTIKVAIDPATSVFKVNNPSEPRPNITFTRVATATFPDVRPLAVDFLRSGQVEYDQVTSMNGRFKLEKPVEVFSWLKMPWDSNDNFQICQDSYGGACRSGYQIGTVTNYPTAININRIDVDHVTVNAADGQVAIVPGIYSVTDSNTKTGIVINAKTQTGIDVLPGEYTVTVYYRDPFTFKEESKLYKLSFK